MLEYLRSKGFTLTITALKCGHSFLTTSGNVSEHSTGDAVDIADIDGVPVTGHQGPGTLTDELIHDVLQLQGTMHPHQVISLEDLPGETSFALPDHYDHVHVGYHPIGAATRSTSQFTPLLKPDQWQRLIDRLGEIENPEVPTEPSPLLAAGRPNPRAARAAASSRRASGTNPEPWHRSSDSRSSTSPGTLALADGRYLARERRASEESVLVVRDARRAAAAAAAAAPAAAGRGRAPSRRRCR